MKGGKELRLRYFRTGGDNAIDKPDYLFYNIKVMLRLTPFQGACLFSSTLHLFLLFGTGRFAFLQGPHPPIKESLELVYLQREGPAVVQPRLPESPVTPKGLGQETLSLSADHAKVSTLSQKGKGTSSQETSSPGEGEIRSEAEMMEVLHLNQQEKPIFLTYYEEIRERIRKNLFTYYRNGEQEGDITLNFVLFPNGQLKKVKALEKGNPSHPGLKEIGMRSVIEASPFPPFPDGFKRASASIWVRVTFVRSQVQRPGE